MNSVLISCINFRSDHVPERERYCMKRRDVSFRIICLFRDQLKRFQLWANDHYYISIKHFTNIVLKSSQKSKVGKGKGNINTAQHSKIGLRPKYQQQKIILSRNFFVLPCSSTPLYSSFGKKVSTSLFCPGFKLL